MAQKLKTKNLVLTSANTQYEYTLPANARRWTAQCRTEDAVRCSEEPGKVATGAADYFTIKAGKSFGDSVTDHREAVAEITLYFAGDTNGLVVEIVSFS